MPTRYVLIDGHMVKQSSLFAILKKMQKRCPPKGDSKRVRNIFTGRCRNECKHGRSSRTGLCLKECKPGMKRSNRCQSIAKKKKTAKPAPKKTGNHRIRLKAKDISFTPNPFFKRWNSLLMLNQTSDNPFHLFIRDINGVFVKHNGFGSTVWPKSARHVRGSAFVL